MKKQEEKNKIAMKLANQYAESYKILELENKSIKEELEDTIVNLSINKNLISDLTSSLKLSPKEKIIIDTLKKENINLNNIINGYKTETSELKKMINMNQTNIEPFLSKSQKIIENLQNKVFLLENTITKKDNIIKNLNSKLEEALYNKLVGSNTIVQEIGVSIIY